MSITIRIIGDVRVEIIRVGRKGRVTKNKTVKLTADRPTFVERQKSSAQSESRDRSMRPLADTQVLPANNILWHLFVGNRGGINHLADRAGPPEGFGGNTRALYRRTIQQLRDYYEMVCPKGGLTKRGLDYLESNLSDPRDF